MDPIRLVDLDAATVGQDDDDDARWRAVFPFTPDAPGETVASPDGASGSDETTAGSGEYTVVYNELDPGTRIGTHRDGVDELLFVVEGEIEATVDGETAVASAGGLAVVPAETPHSVRNTGTGTARLLGYFASGDVESTFESEPVVRE